MLVGKLASYKFQAFFLCYDQCDTKCSTHVGWTPLTLHDFQHALYICPYQDDQTKSSNQSDLIYQVKGDG